MDLENLLSTSRAASTCKHHRSSKQGSRGSVEERGASFRYRMGAGERHLSSEPPPLLQKGERSTDYFEVVCGASELAQSPLRG